VRVFAPAKVNLALHVVGRRDDGYHLLDSLVVFAGLGDWLEISAAPDTPELRLSVTGPRARGVPTDGGNLVWRAFDAFSQPSGVSIVLEKHLPHAGGIGGGSADAGAAIRGLSRLWDQPLPDRDTLLAIGADTPVCVASRPARMRGIGERLDPVPPLPPLWLVLVNPGVAVPTGPVFKALRSVVNAPMPEPDWTDAASFLSWLAETRNDLESAAARLVPEVRAVLDILRAQSACRCARMSGSGATCFGLFASEAEAEAAAHQIRADHPSWWAAAAPVLSEAS
jgi:4-diphosphocytidyl-2-C-methyl-D-erythritol kinase